MISLIYLYKSLKAESKVSKIRTVSVWLACIPLLSTVFVCIYSCRTILVVNNIQLLRKDSSPMFTGQDVSKIRKFSRQKSVVSFLSVLCRLHSVDFVFYYVSINLYDSDVWF